MKHPVQPCKKHSDPEVAISELLLLPDGRLLVHNLTPAMARVLVELSPDDPQIRPRAIPTTQDVYTHELPN